MKNYFEQINKIIDALTLDCSQENSMSSIEKDLIMEKLRKVYSQVVKFKVIEDENVDKQPMHAKDTSAAESVLPVSPSEEPPIQKPTSNNGFPAAKAVLPNEPVHKSTSRAANKVSVDYDLFFDPEEMPLQSETQLPTSQPETNFTPLVPKQVMAEQAAKTETVPSETSSAQPVRRKSETAKPKPKPVLAQPTQSLDEEDDLLQFNPPESAVTAKGIGINTARSLNDLFNERREDHSLGSQFQHTKVGDLTKAISINDKFTYIRELFNNRGEEFSAAIKKLNQCLNMDEAFNQLEELKNQYYWDTSGNAYLSLCDLLRRKFS